jgi:hypothetical protein
MDTKTVYSYNYSGLLIGPVILNSSDQDPLGNWNIPSGCTELVPPDTKTGYDIYFVDGAWAYVAIAVKQYIIRNGIYMYDYYQTGDIVVTEQPTPPNTYTFYKWATTPAISGKRDYPITTNFVVGDTLSLCGITLTLGTDVIGTDSASTAINLKTVLSANTTINALYNVTVSGSTFTLTEIIAGGGNTPSEATTIGTGVITNGTAVTSTASTTGWKIDLATSLDALNSSYSAPKLEIHKQHSGVILANWLTPDQISIAEEALKIAYKTLHDELKLKQEGLKNG